MNFIIDYEFWSFYVFFLYLLLLGLEAFVEFVWILFQLLCATWEKLVLFYLALELELESVVQDLGQETLGKDSSQPHQKDFVEERSTFVCDIEFLSFIWWSHEVMDTVKVVRVKIVFIQCALNGIVEFRKIILRNNSVKSLQLPQI